MGNSNRRANRTNEQRGAASRSNSATSSSIRIPIIGESLLFSKRTVTDKNLAPRTPTTNSDNRDAECPICFVCYESLNVAICCRQSICTECYVQLKESTHRQCPFCNRESLTAEFRRPSIDHSSPKTIITTEEPPTSAAPSNPPSTASNNSNVSAPASKRERELLEAQIRSQRLEFNVAELSESDSRSNSVESSADIRRRSISNPLPTGALSNTAIRSPEYSSERQRRGHRMAAPQRNRFLSEDSEERESFDMFQHGLASSLHQLLEMDELDHMASLEQLEQMMLMEAIRQSMMDSTISNPTPDNINTEEAATTSAPSKSEEAVPDAATNPIVEPEFHNNASDSSSTESDFNDFPAAVKMSENQMAGKSSSPLRLIEEIELALNTPPPSPLRLAKREQENIENLTLPKSYDV